MKTPFVLYLLLSACASEPNQAPKPPETQAVNCGKGDAACAAINGALLFLNAAASPVSAAGVRAPKDSLMGHCSIEIAAKKTRPCEGVVLELKSRDIGERRAWITGDEFEVPSIGNAPLELTARSEYYGVVAKLTGVKSGSFIRIKLEVPK